MFLEVHSRAEEVRLVALEKDFALDYVLAKEVLDCLDVERRIFHYFKHRYALILLALAAGTGRSVSELRRTPFVKLLSKPVVRPVAARTQLTSDELESIWPTTFESYVVTLDRWGDNDGRRGGRQITRRGVNLVVQLNFNASHDRIYRRLLRTDEDDFHPFEWLCHPVNVEGRRTLAWVRLDLDLDEGEALIEEVQSDWIRDAEWIVWELRRERRLRGTCRDHWLFRDTTRRIEELEYYVEHVLPRHKRMWDEAALSAVLGFIVRDIGIREIYYHTWEGGRQLKGMRHDTPPRSIYEKLPRRFCFERVSHAPRFLMREPGHRFRRHVEDVATRHGFWFLGLESR